MKRGIGGLGLLVVVVFLLLIVALAAPVGGWPGIPGPSGTSRPALRQSLHVDRDGVMTIAFSPDGSTLAVSTYNEAVELWDAVRGKRRFALPQPQLSQALAFSP